MLWNRKSDVHLWTHSLHSIQHHNGPITQPHSCGHLGGEVHVAGGVDEVQQVLLSSCAPQTPSTVNQNLEARTHLGPFSCLEEAAPTGRFPTVRRSSPCL